MDPDLFVLVPIAGMATGAFFMFGIYKLVSRWIELRHQRDLPSGVTTDLQELQADVAELRHLPDRVAELEERLDFAERLLAQARHEPGALGSGEP